MRAGDLATQRLGVRHRVERRVVDRRGVDPEGGEAGEEIGAGVRHGAAGSGFWAGRRIVGAVAAL